VKWYNIDMAEAKELIQGSLDEVVTESQTPKIFPSDESDYDLRRRLQTERADQKLVQTTPKRRKTRFYPSYADQKEDLERAKYKKR